MFTIATLKQVWENLKTFPWPTITFLAVLLSAWGWLNFTKEVTLHHEDMREDNTLLIHEMGLRYQEGRDLRQQVIESQSRLIDYLTRNKDTAR